MRHTHFSATRGKHCYVTRLGVSSLLQCRQRSVGRDGCYSDGNPLECKHRLSRFQAKCHSQTAADALVLETPEHESHTKTKEETTDFTWTTVQVHCAP
ncbi:hypothetical protein AOLI_G00327000 [Acnodon oligacanthus]